MWQRPEAGRPLRNPHSQASAWAFRFRVPRHGDEDSDQFVRFVPGRRQRLRAGPAAMLALSPASGFKPQASLHLPRRPTPALDRPVHGPAMPLEICRLARKK
jgi:hypothetical protein